MSFEENAKEIQRKFEAERINAVCKEWLDEGLSSGRLDRSYLSQENRDWMDAWIKTHGDYSKQSLDAAYAELVRQLTAQQQRQEALDKLGVELFDWFAKPTIQYFDGTDSSNLKRMQAWYGAQHGGQAALTLNDWVSFVTKTMWEPGWVWKVSDRDLANLILRAGQGTPDPSMVQFGKVDGHLMPVAGKLVNRFGLANVRRAYELLWTKSHTKTRTSHQDTEARTKEMESSAEKTQHNLQSLSFVVNQAKREIETFISCWRGSTHAATQRDRAALLEVAGDYQNITDASITKVLEAVKAKGNELCPVGVR